MTLSRSQLGRAGSECLVCDRSETPSHTTLLACDYRLVTGNHDEAPSADDTPLPVDLPAPGTGDRRIENVGRGFDAIPGPTVALASDPVQVRAR